jgi:carboxyl-terminal processing protease
MARSVSGWLGCPAKGSRTIRYRTAQSPDERSKRFRCRQPEIERADMGNVQGVPILEEHRMLEGKVGYLRFNIWLLPLMPRIEQAMIELREQGMQALVLDLRGNPGGVGMMVVPLARLLLSESQSLGRMQMRAATQEFNVVAGGGEPFTGRVAVLIDERTASTSEIFAQSMRDLERVRVFGSGPSQGAALPSLIEELPGGAILQYVVADYRSPKGTAVEGAGVTPDVVVAESPADFAAGRDPVRDAAVQALAHRP